jgi:hypothetical protein
MITIIIRVLFHLGAIDWVASELATWIMIVFAVLTSLLCLRSTCTPSSLASVSAKPRSKLSAMASNAMAVIAGPRPISPGPASLRA